MARLEDAINEIRNQDLRNRVQEEVRKLKSDKKFGLVFEEHTPEVVPLYSAPIKKGARVALKSGPLSEVYRVVKVGREKVTCIRDGEQTDEEQTFGKSEVIAVKRFGEPIYPTLVPVDRVERAPGKASHTLIEADNYHALQLLEYLYAGQVDCIYIDPPYNTGARDWKYNNDYVDSNDGWRHSKWLAFMEKRISLCMRLLKSTGILVITIDDYEFHHLRCLLESPQFGEIVDLGIACIRNNPGGRATQNGMAVNHEYALFMGRSGEASIGRLPRTAEQLSRYNLGDNEGPFEWVNFRKHGADSEREDRPKQFYPIYVSGCSIRIPKMVWDEKCKSWVNIEAPRKSEIAVWPIGQRGEEKAWSWGSERVSSDVSQLEARATKSKGVQVYVKSRVPIDEGRLPGTWWDSTLYSSNESGTKVLQKIFDATNPFDFPKSLYAVKDCLRAAGLDRKKNALILDFFAGSGTTLNAVNLLNAADGGQRRCILVTNNEASDKETLALTTQGFQPGQDEWERHGICRSVTWPRNKFTINGQRDDGTPLPGEYLTGRPITKEKTRNIHQLSFANGQSLTVAQRKHVAKLVSGVTQSRITANAWFLDDDTPASILWDITQADTYLEVIEETVHLTDFYVVTTDTRGFNALKPKITAALPPILVEEEEKRPLADGFEANLQYFKLDFLDPLSVELGREFSRLLPTLWMMAGCQGPLPSATGEGPYILPTGNPFAVLLEETQFADFEQALAQRSDITHVFLVTDSADAFYAMKAELPHAHVVQLYKNYLDNFRINTGERQS
ncbi:site-specific DNA-methyltransferase [Sulfurirhabdus autotrophica]|uniref:Adenine-specific DNA-methyltransferase n=1 Tax=Sulfurirhabdus autotrophica TaxID=1706046 RepID=A0A4R3XU81_9PROT|nr:site-specific DNA-methyltransferase [Sulfurirhabdus autotrophica]TCV82690.1 adenine-specific DNA-methyltransferase [Sulfurirhabdus autotrophica]